MVLKMQMKAILYNASLLSLAKSRSDHNKLVVYEKDKKTNDGRRNTLLSNVDEVMCSGWVGSSCSHNNIHRVTFVKSLVLSHERGKDKGMLFSNTDK